MRTVRTTTNVTYWATPGKVVATTQRVASASMAEAFGPAGSRPECRKINRGEVRSLREQENHSVIMWVREPFDRAACAYAIWHKPPFAEMSPTQFALKILGETNPHFSPQLKLHMAGEVFLPTILYPFDNLAKTWAFEFPKYPLPHRGAQPNRMSGQEFKSLIDPEVCKELTVHYGQDIAAHDAAMKLGAFYCDLVEAPHGAA